MHFRVMKIGMHGRGLTVHALRENVVKIVVGKIEHQMMAVIYHLAPSEISKLGL